MYEDINFDAIRRDPVANARMEEFFSLVTVEDDPESPYSLSKVRPAWEKLQSAELNKAFSSARDSVVSDLMANLIDETIGNKLADEKTWYPLLREKMLAQFKKSVFYHVLTAGGREAMGQEMVVEYLQTQFTYIPRDF